MKQHHVAVPLRAPFGGQTVRRVTLVEGPAGWGECSPLPGYPTDPAMAMQAAEEAAGNEWPEPVRAAVPVNGLVLALPPDDAAALAVRLVDEGVRTIKVKVGAGDDEGRVAAIRAAAGPGVRLRVDANCAWDVEEAASVLARLARFDLELAEQPVASLEDMARLRRLVAVPLAADECIRSVEDARRLARTAAADVVVLKVQPLGGVRPALAVAEAAGVPAVVSSLIETSVGLAAGLALAAALPDLPYACGLGTAALLAADVVANPLLPHDGMLALRRPEPDPALLARYAAPAPNVSSAP